MASIDCMVEDIEMLAHDRGMRNLVHADKQPIITIYANEFAEHYKSILQDTLRDENGRIVNLTIGGIVVPKFLECI